MKKRSLSKLVNRQCRHGAVSAMVIWVVKFPKEEFKIRNGNLRIGEFVVSFFDVTNMLKIGLNIKLRDQRLPKHEIFYHRGSKSPYTLKTLEISISRHDFLFLLQHKVPALSSKKILQTSFSEKTIKLTLLSENRWEILSNFAAFSNALTLI